MSAGTDRPAKPIHALTPDELREIAGRVEQRRDSGLAIPGDRVDLYADALRALARERESAK